METIDLKISLKHIKPPIWRQIRISSASSLLDLHFVIQHAFGWTNSHLFIFKIGSMEFVYPPHWEEDAFKFQSAELAILDELIPKLISPGEKFSYVYDMGDNWHHEILIEDIQDTSQPLHGAICLAGARACPPEDVGSLPGYFQLLEDLKRPSSEQFMHTQSWLGYVYDPEAFDLGEVNLYLRDYFKSTQLSDHSLWSQDLPLHHPSIDFVSGWLNQLSPKDREYAQDLAFRKDVVHFLTYVRDHEVKGTKATGNFPLKDIRAIVAGFVNPIVLDQRIGDKIYKLRTEDEVIELLFMHKFLNIGGLILGGENMRWELTRLGEKFLESKPEEQAWFLTKVWFYQFNWEFCYPFYDIELETDIFRFQRPLLKLLERYPIRKPVEIDRLIMDLDRALPGWIRSHRNNNYIQLAKRHFLLAIVIEPFEKFGLIEVVKTEDDDFDFDFNVTYIIMADYGKRLLKYFI
ncbi:MAG: plasmid pRiA4b ORF-3 family protein [Brevefilum sp.]|nr:plasmid pRiA4b ORF-3 family protein [Brevefilum sp.]